MRCSGYLKVGLLRGCVLCLSVYLLGAFPPLVRAQDDFFPKDFAKDPMAEKEKKRDSSRDRSTRPKKATPTPTPSPTPDAIAAQALETLKQANLISEPVVESGDAKVAAMAEKGEKIELVKVRSVSAILSALDSRDFQSRLRDLLDVADKYDLDVGPIYAVGDLRLVYDSENIIPLVARGATIGVVDEPPEPYASVKRSPTFILDTEKGQVILEGFFSIQRFLTSKGEFVDNPDW